MNTLRYIIICIFLIGLLYTYGFDREPQPEISPVTFSDSSMLNQYLWFQETLFYINEMKLDSTKIDECNLLIRSYNSNSSTFRWDELKTSELPRNIKYIQ